MKILLTGPQRLWIAEQAEFYSEEVERPAWHRKFRDKGAIEQITSLSHSFKLSQDNPERKCGLSPLQTEWLEAVAFDYLFDYMHWLTHEERRNNHNDYKTVRDIVHRLLDALLDNELDEALGKTDWLRDTYENGVRVRRFPFPSPKSLFKVRNRFVHMHNLPLYYNAISIKKFRGER